MTDHAIHPAFELVKQQTIALSNIDASLYRHRKTGALHFHMGTNHTENVFLVAFRTVPTDSTGVAHILEHTVLCGSEKYPVRDPFFMMIRRSLNTFMNAFTSSDWTAYPFATQNRKDFANLLDVYLDAAFFPRLDPLDFMQEGHRVEFETPDDPTTPLCFKGVVFNEMKGAMSSPASRFFYSLCEHLFPTVTYHHNSGGNPAVIPELTYEQLKAFHATHYHPSNSVFVTFGDIPAIEHQQCFEDRVLQRFERLEQHIEVPLEKRFTAPKIAEATYPVDGLDQVDKKTALFLAWLLPEGTHLPTVLRAELLTALLLDNSASPLRDYLETTELGTHPASLCGLETDTREMIWVCGLEGAEPESAETFEKEVQALLEKVKIDGVSADQIEAMIHQMELNHREITGGSYPYGLHMIMSTISAFIHRADPFASLDIDQALADLRHDAAQPGFIAGLIDTFLLNNTHRLRLTMRPDPAMNAAENAQEAKRLADMTAALDAPAREKILQQTAALAARQAADQSDSSILPKVGVEDIPEWIEIPEGKVSPVGKSICTHFGETTQGIVYQDVIIPLPPLSVQEIELLGFFSVCWNELGVGDLDYRARQARETQVSGGVSATPMLRARSDKGLKDTGYLCMSGKALERNHKPLTVLMDDLLSVARFDEHDHIKDIFQRVAARNEQSVVGQGHQLAMLSACAGISPLASLVHQLRGLAGIAAMKQRADHLDSDQIKQMSLKMAELYQRLIQGERQYLLIGEANSLPDYLTNLRDVFGQVGGQSGERFIPQRDVNPRDQIWIAGAPVNFCAKVYPTVHSDHDDFSALSVLAQVLRNGYLHRAIREQGGAYGGGAVQDDQFAAFKFYSYRDPRVQGTLDDFDKAVNWLGETTLSDAMLEEGILGVISGLDKPGTPAGEARQAFYNLLTGLTPDQKRQRRSQVLSVTEKDVLTVAERYLRPDCARISVVTQDEGAQLFNAEQYEIKRISKS